MTIQEIQQAIKELSPGELAHFHAWYKEFESNAKIGKPDIAKAEEYLKKLQGSLKDRGGLKTLLDYKHNEAK